MYKSLRTRLPNFLRYVNKVYGFSETIRSMSDNRDRTEISAQATFMYTFICMLLRFGSLRSLVFEVNNGRILKFLALSYRATFCANTIANGLENIVTDILEHELTLVPSKLRRNKAYGTSIHPGTIGGLMIAAVDGTEYYRSSAIHCDECLEYHVKTKEGTRLEYVHKIVLMQTVGVLDSSSVQTILGAEPIRPKDTKEGEEPPGHEGEGVAARRLIEKMISFYGNRFFQVFTTDALYTNEPFVKFVDGLGKYLVSRVKDKRTTLYKEIETLSAFVEPVYVNDWEQQLEYWVYEVPHLETSLGWEIPVSGFRIIEAKYKIDSGEKIYTKKEIFHCMTTLPADMAIDIMKLLASGNFLT
jgi:hypothetical protein